MDNFDLLLKRANDALCQTRCDRRSLATLAKALYQQGYMITSISQLIRTTIEELRNRVIADGAEDVLSYDDADNILQAFGCGGLNPSGRARPTLLRQQGKEALFLDGQPVEYATRTKTTKKILESRKRDIDLEVQRIIDSGEAQKILDSVKNEGKRNLRKPETMVETPAEAEERRQGELKDIKAGLATPPDIIADNNNDGHDLGED